MAYAAAVFVESLLKAIKGEKNVIEPSYVHLDSDPSASAEVKKVVGNIDYFSCPIELGPNGVEKIHQLGKLSEFEQGLVKAALPELEGNIKKGVEFVGNSKL